MRPTWHGARAFQLPGKPRRQAISLPTACSHRQAERSLARASCWPSAGLAGRSPCLGALQNLCNPHPAACPTAAAHTHADWLPLQGGGITGHPRAGTRQADKSYVAGRDWASMDRPCRRCCRARVWRSAGHESGCASTGKGRFPLSSAMRKTSGGASVARAYSQPVRTGAAPTKRRGAHLAQGKEGYIHVGQGPQ